MAMSAHLRSASALSPSFGNVATPMLAVMKVSRPPRSNGAQNASRNFCATSAASSGRARSAITTANSSPPRRDTVWAGRVVHQLEAAEIDAEPARASAAAPRLHDGVLQALAQQVAVREPGHR